jgi:hypothetical protein
MRHSAKILRAELPVQRNSTLYNGSVMTPPIDVSLLVMMRHASGPVNSVINALTTPTPALRIPAARCDPLASHSFPDG